MKSFPRLIALEEFDSLSHIPYKLGKIILSKFSWVIHQDCEAEDDQQTQVWGLEIENISSTMFILYGSAGGSPCSIQELGTGGPEECSKAKYLKWRTTSTPGTTSVYSVYC